MSSPPKKLKTIALLVAAGRSERMGGGLPKPYVQLGDEAILRRTVKAFLEHPDIDGVRVVIRREHHPYYKKSIEGLTLIPCVIGGNSRQESVRLGLESLSYLHPERVLIHDIARPSVSKYLISQVIDGLKQHKAIVPVIHINDTIKHIQNGKVTGTIPREGAAIVQTPQGFDYQSIIMAHRQVSGENLTDDSAVCETVGIPVSTTHGEINNFKITTTEDLKRMENAISLNSEIRVGTGYDVHILKAHDDDTDIAHQTIKLCGVRIPFSYHLVGHSDADVGLHAIVDAILGAIGAGDIGTHFPPSDIKWQGADSARFLLHAYELLKNKGGELVNIDLTLVCERPKIQPHRETMVNHLANILKIDAHRISIKATTTERLGFTGRGEGIAAQAVATVRLPK